ncbi:MULTISPECIES: hypothetical protein [Sphingobacterium]|uniref:hypothetical protein n=1 Tax=Sphingobacterium TaxID=28453 RepID=UPI00257F1D73|nr:MULTISPECIES: hypothetical protein [Sphingobacterium]
MLAILGNGKKLPLWKAEKVLVFYGSSIKLGAAKFSAFCDGGVVETQSSIYIKVYNIWKPRVLIPIGLLFLMNLGYGGYLLFSKPKECKLQPKYFNQ